MLYDENGNRKYLTSEERSAFIAASRGLDPATETFCLTPAYTGARISEVLKLKHGNIDLSVRGVVIECLKRRRKGIFRVVPVPDIYLDRMDRIYGLSDGRLSGIRSADRIWPWCRTTAWARVKSVMRSAGVVGTCATPKGLRHGLGVESTAEAGIPVNIVQRWLGHARIETTAIYADATGREERALARRTWHTDDP